MSRIENTSKNFAFSLVATLVTSVTSFISRAVFIKTIGVSYLGASSLFTNILSMLSLTELGLGSAIAYSLYAPLAKNDIDTIKSLMRFYKNAYRVIAFVIMGAGLALIPFLDFLIKDPGDIQHIPLIYLFFLYNTIVSYLFTYKTTLLIADQRGYVLTNMTTVINVGSMVVQICVLLICKNYFVYLVTGAIINTAQWFWINRRIFRIYPFLKEKNILPLAQVERKKITTNVKAMVFHKFGELCINQTDNIIISSIISITAVGIYNNYYMIIAIINKFAQSIFSAATASLGNLIATESKEIRYEVFKRYNFLGFWVFGWTGICLYELLTPFIQLWLGADFLIDNLTLTLVMLNYYLVGMRITVSNIKMAAGLYAQDQWVPVVQAIINLVVSIVAAIHMGLAGVFLGTVVSGLAIPCWYRPIIVYKHTFERSPKEYFITYIKYFSVVMISLMLVKLADTMLVDTVCGNVYVAFLAKMMVCAVLPNLLICLVFWKNHEFRYFINFVKTVLRRRSPK